MTLTSYEQIEFFQSELRDLAGLVPLKSRDEHYENIIKSLEKLLSDHSQALQALEQINRLSGKGR